MNAGGLKIKLLQADVFFIKLKSNLLGLSQSSHSLTKLELKVMYFFMLDRLQKLDWIRGIRRSY